LNLYPYQEAGAAFLSRGGAKGLMLADEPGLGKTRQAIAAATLLDALRAVVVCPASAIGVWRREIKEMGADARCNWLVGSFNKPPIAGGPIDVLIVDEAHYAKTRDAARTKALYGEKLDGVGGLIDRTERVFLLTGTPTPNNPSEIWTHARACFPAAIATAYADGSTRPMAYWTFVKNFCVVEENYLGHMKIVGGKNLEELRARLAPFVLRRLKKDVLADLPPVRFSILPVEGRVLADAVDAALIRKALEKGAAGLREIAPHVATLRRMTGIAKVDGVCAWAQEWFAGGGGKLVIFAHHKDVIGSLKKTLSIAGIPSVVVDGAVPPEKRGLCAEVFQKDPNCRVFIGQNDAAGTAITLTAADTLLSLEPAWTPGVNDQIWQRIHRIGQANACQIYYPTIAGSIDEDVTRALIPKQGAIDALWN
jgi:SWI/SNF-related matrix-associated actin-dependent regulator 1 of chromatin subfamily A